MNPEDRLRELRDPDRWAAVRVPRPAPGATGRAPAGPARVGQLIAAFAIAIVVVAGLVVGLVALHGSTPPATTSGPTSSSTVAPAKPATFTVVPGATAMYSSSRLPTPCRSAQLRASSKQDGGGAAGSYIQALSVLNSGHDCLLRADAVRVGGTVASFASPNTPHGLVLPSLALARLVVTTAEACQPDGSKANIDPSRPVLPIALSVGGRSRVMTARFPESVCHQPSAEALLDDGGSDALSRVGLSATVAQPSKTPRGTLRYDVSVRTTGTAARVLTACPAATEVLSDGLGAVVTRALALRCSIGTVLEPDVPVSVSMSTTIPAGGDWTISWYLGGGATTATMSSTCSLAQLEASEPGPGGASGGSWVQLVSVRDRGGSCTLPVTAFAVGGRAARAGQAARATGFVLAAGSTARFSVAAATTCADGTVNIHSIRSLGADAKPVVLELGGRDASGLDQPFPRLFCAGPVVDRLG